MVTGTRPNQDIPTEPVDLEPLLPYYVALSAALSRRGRHGEAAVLLQQAQRDAGPAQEQVGGLLVDELVADADHEKLLAASLDLVDSAPIAACRALMHLLDSVRPAQLPNAAQLLLERDWAAFARRAETPEPIRADILAAVAELLQEHLRFQDSADLLRTLPQEFTGDLRFQLLFGTALVALRQWPAAQVVLTDAVRALSPSTLPELAERIRFTSAALYERLGQVSEALPLLDPEATTGPATRARCLALRALCLVQTGRPEQAQEERAAADELAPEAETVVVTGAWVLLGTGDFRAAADRAAEGVRRYPESDELSFLRSQARIASDDDVANQARRVRRLMERLDPADLTVLVDRTLRVRADADASLHYFLALVERAANRDDEALVSAGKAVARLGAGHRKARLSRLTVAARRLWAELLEDSDPAGAAAEYAAAGNDAFGLDDWNTTVELLGRARRLGTLDQLGHWNLAEAYFLTSFATAEPMGISERQLRQAVETWDGAFAEQLPDVNAGWAYVSRARMEMRLARLDRRMSERALRTLLYCECGLALGVPTPALVNVYADSTRALGLYALGAEVPRQGLEAEPDDGVGLQNLFTNAVNGGDLQLARAYLSRLERATVDTSWHTDAARLCLLAGDAREALDELAQVAQGDRYPLYFEWYELLAYARLGDADGVAAVLGRAHARLEEMARGGPASADEPLINIGLELYFRLLLGEPEAAAAVLERMADEDSWWNDLALDAALVGLLGGRPSVPSADVSGTDGTDEEAAHRFVERTRLLEDVSNLSTMLGELRALSGDGSHDRPVDGLDDALERLRKHARERLDRGGWPLTVEVDLASLLDRPWSPEQEPLARAAEAAIAARRALEGEDWQVAIEGYRSLLAADEGFPEAEQGLVGVIARAIRRSLDGDSHVLADVARRLAEALPWLSGVRRRPTATDLLEVWLGDAHLYLEDLDGARLLYEAAVAVAGERAARHVVAARLHVGAALLERPADGPGLDTVLEACPESGAQAAKVVLDAAAALVQSAAGWERLIHAWEGSFARLTEGARHKDVDQVALLLVEATAQAGSAWRQQGDLERAQAELRRAFELHRNVAGPDNPDVLTRRYDLAIVLTEQGRFADAEAELRGVINGRSRELGKDDEDTVSARLDLGKVLFTEGQLTDAEAEFRLVADARSRLLGEDSTETWDARYFLAKTLQEEGRLEEAERSFRDVLEAELRLRGAQTAGTLSTRFELAWTLERLGRFAEAAEEYRGVLEGRVRLLGADDPTTLAARSDLAWSLYRAAELGPAEAEYRAVIEARVRQLGADDVATLAARLELGLVLRELGRLAEAEAEYRAVIEARVRQLGADDPATLTARLELAWVLEAQERYAEAEAELRVVAEGRGRQLGADDPATLAARLELGLVLRELGRLAEAEAELRVVAEGRGRVLGADDPATLLARYHLAGVLRVQGDLGAAEAEYREVLAAETRLQGAEDPSTLITRHQLAAVLRELGRLAEAEAELRVVAEGRGRVLGADDPATLTARLELAWVLETQERYAEAEAELRVVAEARGRVLGADDPATLAARLELGLVLRELGRLAEAEAEYRAVIEARVRQLGADDPATLTARLELAWVLEAQERYAEAEAELRVVAEGRGRVLGADDPATLAARLELGLVLRELGRLAEAEAELRVVAEGRGRVLGADDPATLLARYHLAGVLRVQGDLGAAEAEYREVLAAETRLQGAEDPSTLITRHQLAAVLRELGRLAEAEAE